MLPGEGILGIQDGGVTKPTACSEGYHSATQGETTVLTLPLSLSQTCQWLLEKEKAHLS